MFELLKEIARAVVRELSAYVLRKQLQKRTAKKTKLHCRKLIAKNAGIEFDNINKVVKKYYGTYRIKSVAQLS
ncbi:MULTISPECIES: hypothetical protein [Bacillus]|uniref:hypothetical protein n=1 Tax=Bacillus TaxID=1386 RepID=UPI000DEBBFF3|nr:MULTISPECIES: hypothetical protein [Bacillus]